MTRIVASLVFLALSTNTVVAADPPGSRTATKSGPPAVVQPNPYAQALERLAERERQTVRDVLELLVGPLPRFAEFVIRRADGDPNVRMARLLNESEDLRQARAQWHQFWMNNQPNVITYERTKGPPCPKR